MNNQIQIHSIDYLSLDNAERAANRLNKESEKSPYSSTYTGIELLNGEFVVIKDNSHI